MTRLNVTARDIKLLRKLSVYGMLSTKQTNVLVFNSIAITTVLRRLRLLESSLYVKRIRGLDSQDVLWVLTEKGALLAEVEVPKRHWSKSLLDHDFKLLQLRLAMEGCGVAHSWHPEHEIRAQIFKNNNFRAAKEKVIPDGLMSIERAGFKESVAVEMELRLKSSKRYDEIFLKYSGNQKITWIWYVAPTKGILKQVLAGWLRVKAVHRVPYLCMSFLDEVMKDPLKARLIGESNQRKLGEFWTQTKSDLAAHPPAQGVSGQVQKNEVGKIELSAEDHTPIREDVA